MFYSTIMKIDSIDRLRDIRDALLVEQGINPTRQGEQAIKVVVDRIDEIQATLDKSASRQQSDFVLRFVTTRRRLLRKGVYKYNRVRTRQQQFVRENKNLVKTHQNPKKEISATKMLKLRPKREADKGFKMSYRYKYYSNFSIVDDEEAEEDEL